MRVAVIVTTYNRPDALAAVLDGYLAQTDAGFELVVADDGSGPKTRALVEDYARRAPFRLGHVWQEDAGFRAAAIRNQALAGTDAGYVIFTDGDCVPTPGFVAQHRRLAEPGWFLSANRVLLAAAFTRKALAILKGEDMTKPSNFPERKNRRRIRALERLKANKEGQGPEADILRGRILPQARDIRTKKIREKRGK